MNSAHEFTDTEIVAGVYEKWGAECLGRLIGDWALSIWNPCERWVILAKDPMGKRHLYYSFDNKQLTWSTILHPLVLFAGKTFEICEEYIAGWFSPFPAAHLTPYVGIHAVPPSSSVHVRPLKDGVKHTIRKYWDFDPSKKIRYRTDAEYEEHFRTVFAMAVRRCLRSDRPVLAELSGGMDSSSIVCMADVVIARADAETPRLDTISWYDNGNSDLDEYPYFTKVEEKRCRIGCHIDLGLQKQIGSNLQRSFASEFENDCFAAIPDSPGRLEEFFNQYAAYMMSQGNRAVLSGIGGNEVTGGGVPTPRQELQDLLVRARFGELAQQLNAWAVKMRKHRLRMLWEAISGFLSLSLSDQVLPQSMRLAPWFDPGFVRRNRAALCGYPSRVKLFGPLPSFQDNLVSLAALRRTLAYFVLQPKPLRDLRYPYLDRGLLEFLYAIPRQQIVRPGQRRSLMRRALVGIVPNELLNRKRKAFVPTKSENDNLVWPNLVEIDQHMFNSSLRIVDQSQLSEALQKASRNEDVSIGGLKRTLTLAFWLQHLTIQGVLSNPVSTNEQGCSFHEAKETPKVRSAKQFG